MQTEHNRIYDDNEQHYSSTLTAFISTATWTTLHTRWVARKRLHYLVMQAAFQVRTRFRHCERRLQCGLPVAAHEFSGLYSSGRRCVSTVCGVVGTILTAATSRRRRRVAETVATTDL